MQGVTGAISLGKKTVTADTIIQHLIRPFKKSFTRVTALRYLCGSTAHVITCRMPIGWTTLSASPATGQAVINLTAQPTSARAVAANDYLVIEGHDTAQYGAADNVAPAGLDTYDLVKVSSVSSLAITLTANVARAYAAGRRVWLMSLDADTIPGYGTTNPKLDCTVSVATEYPTGYGYPGGIWDSFVRESPLVIESNNATAAGTFELVRAIGWVPSSPRR